MPTIDDGTYVIVNAANTSLAIDSRGATDGNNSNVWLFTRNSTDAQFVTVFTRSDGTRQLMFACTGKCVDVVNGTVAQGQNVQQHTDNGSSAQQWTITALDGETVTIDGTSYQLYKIYLTETDTEYLLEYEGTGTPVSGGNLCIARDETVSDDQKWAFIPANPVATGTYIIHPKVDTRLALDVQGSSHGIGAHVIVSGSHVGSGTDYGNNQVVWLRQYDDNGRAKLAFCHTFMLCEIFDMNTAKSGTHVCQCGDYGGTDQQWIITPHGTTTLNGLTVPCYQLRNYAAQGTPLLMDVCGGGTTPGTHVQIYTQNNSAAQDFCFEPTSMVAPALPVPSILGLTTDEGGSGASSSVAANGSPEFRAAWSAAGTTWQVRYRYRTRAVGHSLSNWGQWLSAADNTAANEGWGSTWLPNVTTENTSVKTTGVLTLPVVDCETNDYAEMQVEVRAFETDYQGKSGLTAHGNPGMSTIKLCWKPTLTITGLGWSPDGLIVSYKTDYPRGGNTITVNSVMVDEGEKVYSALAKTLSVDGLGQTGTFIVPLANLSHIPADGSTVTIVATLRTDAWTVNSSGNDEVAYTENNGITLVPVFQNTDRYTTIAAIPVHDETSVWAVWDDNVQKIEPFVTEDGYVKYEIIPPLGVDFRIHAMVRDSDGSWATVASDHEPISAGVCVWNWESDRGQRCAIVNYNSDKAIEQDDTRKADVQTITTTGRTRPVYRFGPTQTRNMDVNGSLVEDEDAKWSTRASLVELLEAHFAWFRNPRGELCRVAITGLSTPHDSAAYGSVTVNQEETA